MLRYRISAKDPAAHHFEVTVITDRPDAAGQAFVFPAWIPGSYMIRDLARNVVSITAEADGQEVQLTKTDKSTWLADPCAGPLTLTAEIVALDASVRGAYLDTTHGFFDGACVFPAVTGQEDDACSLEIVRPDGGAGGDWRVVTSMKSAGAAPYDFGKYCAENYAELIDHPVEMGNVQIGEFDVCGIPHAIAVQGHPHFDMARICHDLTKLCESQIDFLGKPANLDRYVFLLMVREAGYGGLEHRWSSSLMCGHADLPRRGDTKVTEDYRKFLGLCSHEYFHLWNVKRIKPARFTPYDLNVESHTGLLWVFEGITSYYDDLILARSGLISVESLLELIAKTVTRVERARGRLKQTIEDSSFDAWTRFYKQDANSPNAIVSYYAKGSLIALALDLTIRKETAGKFSLDDVMKEAWKRYGETGVGMPERGFETLARNVTGLELQDFFERYVRGTGDLPLEGLMKTVGVNLRFREAANSKDMGGKPAPDDTRSGAWLGATLARNGAVSKFMVVHSGSPAEQAGIVPGDEAVAINDLRLTAENVDARLRDYQAGDTVTVTVFRDQILQRLRVRFREAPRDTCYMEVDASVAPSVQDARKRWLDAG